MRKKYEFLRGERGESGVSLVEVMVGMWIFFTLAVGMLSVITAGLRAARAISCKTSAINRAQEAIEEIKSWPYDRVTKSNVDEWVEAQGDIYLTSGWSKGGGGVPAKRTIQVEEIASEGKKLVIVEVLWDKTQDPEGEYYRKSATLSAYIYQE